VTRVYLLFIRLFVLPANKRAGKTDRCSGALGLPVELSRRPPPPVVPNRLCCFLFLLLVQYSTCTGTVYSFGRTTHIVKGVRFRGIEWFASTEGRKSTVPIALISRTGTGRQLVLTREKDGKYTINKLDTSTVRYHRYRARRTGCKNHLTDSYFH
jgi:hypothetical protein